MTSRAAECQTPRSLELRSLICLISLLACVFLIKRWRVLREKVNAARSFRVPGIGREIFSVLRGERHGRRAFYGIDRSDLFRPLPPVSSYPPSAFSISSLFPRLLMILRHFSLSLSPSLSLSLSLSLRLSFSSILFISRAHNATDRLLHGTSARSQKSAALDEKKRERREGGMMRGGREGTK